MEAQAYGVEERGISAEPRDAPGAEHCLGTVSVNSAKVRKADLLSVSLQGRENNYTRVFLLPPEKAAEKVSFNKITPSPAPQEALVSGSVCLGGPSDIAQLAVFWGGWAPSLKHTTPHPFLGVPHLPGVACWFVPLLNQKNPRNDWA